MNLLEVKKLVCGYEKKEIIKGVTFSVEEGEFVGIIGPNGSGKTTLFRALSGFLKPWSGNVLYRGIEMCKFSPMEIAKEVAVMPQSMEVPFSFSVEEFVEMGRFPHTGRLRAPTAEDRKAIDNAMDMAEVAQLKEKYINQLSGGERQRVFFAQALAQEPRFMLLDEPTTHLDIKYQIEAMELMSSLNEKGITIIAILHDLNMAAEYCDRLILLKDGAVKADGNAKEVIDYKTIEDAYKTVVVVRENPISGKPYVVMVSKKNLKKK